MKNNLVWLKIECQNYYKLLTRINKIGISIYDNKKYDDYLLIKTTYEDYERIKKQKK